MKKFKEKVAVITGAASGIGRAIAERCTRENMKVVLADIEVSSLRQVEEALKSMGGKTLTIPTDVSKAEDIDKLAQRVLDTFGAVHLLFNNAGVAGNLTSVWKSSIAEWKWVLEVNLWGVIHGIRVFVPIMLKQDTECHIVNTSSLSGVTSGPGLGVYKVSKHGIVTLSETLYNELTRMDSKISVSVLCPNMVSTRIADSERNRPKELCGEENDDRKGKKLKKSHQEFRKAIETGMPAEEVAAIVFDAIKKKKFYIFTHAEAKPLIKMRCDDILMERNPSNPLH